MMYLYPKIFGMDIIELKARSNRFYMVVNVLHNDLLEGIVERHGKYHKLIFTPLLNVVLIDLTVNMRWAC
jgi:hypothetical protein